MDVDYYSKLDGIGYGPAKPSGPGVLSANDTEISQKCNLSIMISGISGRLTLTVNDFPC